VKRSPTSSMDSGGIPEPRASRSLAGPIGIVALLIGFLGFLTWGMLAPLDEGVAAPSAVTVDTKRKAVQHLNGGIVREVLIREGQVVQEGQVLMRLDAAAAAAHFESARQRYFGLRATEGRLIAEQAGLARIAWHPDLHEGARDPLIRQQMDLQQQLMQTRRAALHADLATLRESVRGQEGLVRSYQGMLETRRQQQGLIEEELRNLRGLVQEGYAPRNRQLELERTMADSLASQTELQGNLVRAQQMIQELRERANARQHEYRKEIETLRADVTREVQSEAARFVALREELGRTEIRSPATGQVLGLGMQTPGGVISAGERLMDIVPSDAPLMLEARVAPHVIDRVHAGLPVDIRFNAFSHTPTLVVDGTVASVSADLITEPQTRVTYYLARVSVTPEGHRKLGTRQMQPGMPAEVIIKTGERTLFTYFAGPLVKRVAASMKEE